MSSWVLREDGEMVECMGEDSKARVVGRYDLAKQNPPKASGATPCLPSACRRLTPHTYSSIRSKIWPSSLISTKPPSCITLASALDTTASMLVPVRMLRSCNAADTKLQTYSGPFLVAVNPYRRLDGYYTPQAVQRKICTECVGPLALTNPPSTEYMNKRREENPPHIFAVAQQAWAQMISERESQSILVTFVNFPTVVRAWLKLCIAESQALVRRRIQKK